MDILFYWYPCICLDSVYGVRDLVFSSFFVNSFILGFVEAFVWKNRVTDLLSVRTTVGFVASHKMCANSRNAIYRLAKCLWSKSTFSFVRGRKFLIQTRQVRTSFFSIGSFGPGYLQPWGHIQRFWSLHLSLRLTVPHDWVVPMPVRKHHSVLCLLNQRFPSILIWCWLGLLFLRVYWMGWAFQPSWECNFCNNSRTPDIAAKPFSIWGISIYLGSFGFCEFMVILPRMKWFGIEIQLSWLQNGTFQL